LRSTSIFLHETYPTFLLILEGLSIAPPQLLDPRRSAMSKKIQRMHHHSCIIFPVMNVSWQLITLSLMTTNLGMPTHGADVGCVSRPEKHRFILQSRAEMPTVPELTFKRELDLYGHDSSHLDRASAALDKGHKQEEAEMTVEKWGPPGTIAKFRNSDNSTSAGPPATSAQAPRDKAGRDDADEEDDAHGYREVDDEILAGPPDLSDADGSLDVPPVDLL
jgi:hypothetical protein